MGNQSFPGMPVCLGGSTGPGEGQVKLETTRRFYRMDRRQIGYVKFILEAYDNLAVLSTVDAQAAVVGILVAPGCEALVEGIMDSFKGKFEVALAGDGSWTGFAHIKNG
jgi:hypothetical protein